MTPRNLFTVILQIFGMFFFREILQTTALLVDSLIAFFGKAPEFGTNTHFNNLTSSFYLSYLFNLILYVFISYQLLFNTTKILNKLKLDQGFTQEEFSFNFQPKFVLTVALVVVSGVILLNEVPSLCKNILFYFQQKELMPRGQVRFDFSYIIISAVKIVIGLVLIGERTRIVSFLEKQES